MRTAKKLVGALLAAVVLAAVIAIPAQAYENITPGFSKFEVTPSSTEAGGHPNVTINLEYRQDSEGECAANCSSVRRQSIHWPDGFIGNPHVTPKCTLTEFQTFSCPSDSQIGNFFLDFGGLFIFVPIYNMQTNPQQAGLLAFTAPLIATPVQLELSGRTNSDYGLDAISSPQLRLPFNHFILELWGVPASPDNTPFRFHTPLAGLGGCPIFQGSSQVGCPHQGAIESETYAPSTVPPAPFLQNPTTCGVPLVVEGGVEYHNGDDRDRQLVPGRRRRAATRRASRPACWRSRRPRAPTPPPASTRCSRSPRPRVPITPAPSELHVARVTLPKGFSINPGAADGKLACPEALSAIGTLGAASCPEFSKIGTATLDVAALPEPIPGALYLAEPKPGEPYRVLLTASGFATNVKLLGNAETDPQTGQVTVAFRSLPQSPLQEFNLHMFGSERGLFATPTQCGSYDVESEFVPWNTALATRHSTNTITIDSGPNGTPCPNGPRHFAPGLEAGVANNTAGLHSPFSLTLTRSDGEQNLTALDVTTPPGFAATLKGVPYCSDAALAKLAGSAYSGVAEQASPACSPASQIGTATAGAGAGTHPLYTPGKVYLAGPYKGAPISLVVVIPAVSGPYDLGNVAVRTALDIDPVTAQVTAVSDSLPQILGGIPLRVRSILIDLDRPDFAVNPTNCDPFSVQETTFGDEGAAAAQSVPFQVANCSDLPYGPKLKLKLTGGTKRLGHPAIKATFTARPGEANTRSVQVSLPPGELLDNAHIGNICTRPAFKANNCPADSMLGTAEVTTPLLDRPLKGNVYLRANPDRRTARTSSSTSKASSTSSSPGASTRPRAKLCGRPSRPHPTRRSARWC